MKREIIWLALSFLILVATLLASCARAVTEEKEVAPPVKEEVTIVEVEEEAVTPQPPPSPDEIEKARQTYDANLMTMVLRGTIKAPEGFDAMFSGLLGKDRLEALRSGREQIGGRDKDIAAVCLLRLDVPLATLYSYLGEMTVTRVSSSYSIADGDTSGFFKTGQSADILLSGFDFNNAGDPLVFNHPGGITSDGTRLFLADTFNNRVLVWNTLPTGNVPPDMVLGQKDFITNNPGTGRDEMDWPMALASDGQRLLVADVFNDRILIWNTIPTTNGAPADIVLKGSEPGQGQSQSKSYFAGPWGVWTDGEKLAVSSTWGGSKVLIWNSFPTQDDQPADIVLTGGGKMGTPRHITSNGKSLIIGDHNARVEGQSPKGSFFWKTFPTQDDQPHDFYLSLVGAWLRGTFAPDGRLILIDNAIRIWNSFPESATDKPDLSVEFGDLKVGGDYVNAVVAGGHLYICEGNLNKVLVFNSVPTQADQAPDSAIGSPDLETNTLYTNFIMSNPTPVSNGENLFVAAGFDRTLNVWKQLPDQSGAHPDLLYKVNYEIKGISLWKDTLAMGGQKVVHIWNSLPLNGELPDRTFIHSIGSVQFNDISGVAMDDEYFYISDEPERKIYVWKGLPFQDSEPAFILEIDEPEGAIEISSDGNYLTAAIQFQHKALVYPVEGLNASTTPISVGGHGQHNGVGSAGAAHGHFFLVDSGFNRVHIWRSVSDALAGKPADVILGANSHMSRPEIGRNTFFWPLTFSFDGSYLWVGEVKFSMRVLRFSPSP